MREVASAPIGRDPDGVLVVDKPAGMTSHDVVDDIRRRFKTKKVGHGGTLDPDATGVLVVGLGRATRFLSYTQTSPKRYRATARFGVTTTTQDSSGAVLARRPADVTREQVVDAMTHFVGAIEQLPPMVSAVKVGGERLYKRARRGEEVERRARVVTITNCELLEFRSGELPEARIDVMCSSGTYVRTLIHDIGQVLGCGAHLASLRRTLAGGFSDAQAVALERVDPSALRPVADAVRFLGVLQVDERIARLARQGRAIDLAHADGERIGEGDVVSVVHGRALVGVYRRRGSSLIPDRVVAK